VNGEYDRGGSCTNRAEADAVVRYIEEHMSTPGGARTSLGVVTFNSAQQDLIETLLDDRRRVNAALDHAIATAKGEPLFIKNLEAVQGDERDVILFSTTYGPDKAGKMTMNFGPINRDGGHRRLNVAVSRARLEVVVFSGLRPEHFSSARTGAAGVRDLMAYISFAEKGPRALLERSAPTGREADSPFETEVATALRERGWDVHLQVGCSGYRIDMAVVDPRAPGRYLLGVECDGRAYHSGATARDRDRLRQLVLESLGWRLHRIWSTDWWRDRARALDRVHALLEQLVAEPVAVDGTDSPACGPDGPDPQATEVSSDGLDGQAAPPATPATLRSLGPLAAPRGADDPPKSAEATEPIYVICGLRSEDPAKFDNPSTSAVLRRQLSEVVATEGPVLDTVAFQRVAKAWGFSRMGAKIRGRIEGCLPVDVLITREGQRKFLWPPTLVPSTWRGYRLPSEVDDSRRSVDEICLHEIGNLTLSVLNQQGRCGTTDLIRFVARRLGVGRTSADIEQRLRAALDDLVARGLATTREGYATPTTR
jgi:very-short-patch-repair endonuclease